MNSDETGLSTSVAEVDRMLLMALKKNLKAARLLATALPDGPQKENLNKMLKKHPLSPPEKLVEQPVTAPSEAMKRHSRLERYLDVIAEENFQTVLDLVKSFCRRKKGTGREGGPAEIRPRKPRGRKKRVLGESGLAATSGASSATVSDLGTEAGKS